MGVTGAPGSLGMHGEGLGGVTRAGEGGRKDTLTFLPITPRQAIAGIAVAIARWRRREGIAV